jgi:hypothetical protein
VEHRSVFSPLCKKKEKENKIYQARLSFQQPQSTATALSICSPTCASTSLFNRFEWCEHVLAERSWVVRDQSQQESVSTVKPVKKTETQKRRLNTGWSVESGDVGSWTIIGILPSSRSTVVGLQPIGFKATPRCQMFASLYT